MNLVRSSEPKGLGPEIEQKSEEWLRWRQGGIGSSDMPAVMGKSEYTTEYQLWELKVGIKDPTKGNFATHMGHTLEPIAREHYEYETGIKMVPTNFVHPNIPYLRASLDGYNAEQNALVEIKCVGREKHEMAKNHAQIPEMYMIQMQHQLLVSGAKYGHYYSYSTEEGDGVIVDVIPNKKLQMEIVDAAAIFWNRVKTRTPPPLGERDFFEIVPSDLMPEDQKRLLFLIEQWIYEKEIMTESALREKRIRDEIVKRLPHSRLSCLGLKISKQYRSGSIDYKAIPELKSIDLEQYRKSEQKASYVFRYDPKEKEKNQ